MRLSCYYISQPERSESAPLSAVDSFRTALGVWLGLPIGSAYLIDSLPAALDKLFIFSFKISVIFVKLLRRIFQILQERALKGFACEAAHMV